MNAVEKLHAVVMASKDVVYNHTPGKDEMQDEFISKLEDALIQAGVKL